MADLKEKLFCMRITPLNLKIINSNHLFLSLENNLKGLMEEFGMGSFALLERKKSRTLCKNNLVV